MKNFIIVKDKKIVYDTDNYLNLRRKQDKLEGQMYEKL